MINARGCAYLVRPLFITCNRIIYTRFFDILHHILRDESILLLAATQYYV